MRPWIIATPLLAVTASASAGLSGIGAGDTITLDFTGPGAYRTVSSTVNGGVSYKSLAGGLLNYSYSWTGGSGSLQAFCVQIDESLTYGAASYDVKDVADVPDSPPAPGPMGEARATLLEDLYARNYSTVMAQSGGDLQNYAAAFAMVIWEITHQESLQTTASALLNDLNLTAGNARFGSSATVNTLASTMLSGLGGGTGTFQTMSGLFGVTNPTYQDLLIVVPGPAGMAGLVGLAAVRRRRRR